MSFGDSPKINEAQRSFRRELRKRIKECVSDGRAARSKKTNRTHAKNWRIFYERMRMEEECLAKGTVVERAEMIDREDETLLVFLVFVLSNPRDDKRASEGKHNRAGYAQQVVFTVREEVERQSGRKVGVVGESKHREARSTAIRKALRRKLPAMKTHRRPVLVQHLADIFASQLLTGNSVEAKISRTELANGSTCLFVSERVGDFVGGWKFWDTERYMNA